MSEEVDPHARLETEAATSSASQGRMLAEVARGRRARRVWWLAGGFIASGLVSVCVSNLWIKSAARPYLYEDVGSVPPRSVAIVPGARVYSDGSPSTVLADRLDAAARLYEQGRVERILVSGDHRTDDYDETGVMQAWLRARGIPARDIAVDPAGLRTFATMERAHRVYEIDDAVVCTNEFHLERSVFLARRAGIDAVGLVSDRRRYRRLRAYQARELLARTRAFLDSYILSP